MDFCQKCQESLWSECPSILRINEDLIFWIFQDFFSFMKDMCIWRSSIHKAFQLMFCCLLYSGYQSQQRFVFHFLFWTLVKAGNSFHKLSDVHTTYQGPSRYEMQSCSAKDENCLWPKIICISWSEGME